MNATKTTSRASKASKKTPPTYHEHRTTLAREHGMRPIEMRCGDCGARPGSSCVPHADRHRESVPPTSTESAFDVARAQLFRGSGDGSRSPRASKPSKASTRTTSTTSTTSTRATSTTVATSTPDLDAPPLTSTPLIDRAWVRACIAFAMPFVLGHGAEQPDAADPAERFAALLVAILRPFLLAFGGGATPALVARLEAAAAVASGYEGRLDWPGRVVALVELKAQSCSTTVLDAVCDDAAPPFETGPLYWHRRAWKELAARGLPPPDMDAPRHAISDTWPSAGERPSFLANDAPADPYPSRAALLLDACDGYSTPSDVLEALRAEVHEEDDNGAPIDPGPFYWATRLATLLAARPRVVLGGPAEGRAAR